MADYNPDAPRIVGNEWVPLKYDAYSLDRSQEIGTTFTLDTTTTVVSGRVYTGDLSMPTLQSGDVMMAVYPESLLGEGGPIQQVIIPCNGAVNTGTGSITSDSGSFVTDLGSPSDVFNVNFTLDPSETAFLDLRFATIAASAALSGKRIAKVELLYSLEDTGTATINFIVGSSTAFVFDSTTGTTFALNEQIFKQVYADLSPVSAIDLGTAREFSDGRHAYPWTYTDLAAYDNGAISPLSIQLGMFANPTFPAGFSQIQFSLQYAALRVSYCEEKRVLFGGLADAVSPGLSSMILRSPTVTGVGASLAAGRYAVTVTRVNSHGTTEELGPIDLNAIIEEYPMIKQTGVILPVVTELGDQAVPESTSTMVQLSLHTSSAAVTGVHPYGMQIASPVWGGATTPTRQGVLSQGAGSYPLARYYARHLEGTTEPLTLRHATFTSIAASITVADFDALAEIVDGWRRVDLTFAAPTPSMGVAGTLETYEWFSNATVGTQWQILSAAAPAITGTSTRVQIAGPNALNANTYGAATAFLTHSGVADPTADATLMFSTGGPAVSGLAVSLASIPVTGIGTLCTAVPVSCIPTGISYNALTWTALSAASVPASGFGYYEVQRSDAETNWQSILHATSPTVTGFHDLEARVGLASDYRIRFVDRLGFPGAWSSTVSSTVTAPGVTGAHVTHGVLIFTSNQDQSGAQALAYSMQWDRDVSEGFEFLESATVDFQRMYNRDYQVAFHGTERGGERFSRTLLVQAAAVPSGLIQDGFRSLRDLAWADLDYVCVRDELGDRWFAAVQVPSGDVRRRRTLYMAEVVITEVQVESGITCLPAGTCPDATWGVT